MWRVIWTTVAGERHELTAPDHYGAQVEIAKLTGREDVRTLRLEWRERTLTDVRPRYPMTAFAHPDLWRTL